MKIFSNIVSTTNNTMCLEMAAFVRSNFFEYLTGTAATAVVLKQIPAYDAIRNSLTRALKNIYPNMKVHFFGSRINGLGNKDSDLDIFIDIGEYDTLSVKTFLSIRKVTCFQMINITHFLARSKPNKMFN